MISQRTLTILLACLGAGIAIYQLRGFITPYLPSVTPFFNAIDSFALQAYNGLQALYTNIQGNWAGYATGIGAFATVISILYSKVYSKAKNKIEQTKEAQVGDMRSQLTSITEENKELLTQNKTLTNQLANINAFNNNIAEMQASLSNKDTQITQLLTEKSELQRVLKALTPQQEEKRVH